MIPIQQKSLSWLGDSLDTVKNFAQEAKNEVGHQLGRVQPRPRRLETDGNRGWLVSKKFAFGSRRLAGCFMSPSFQRPHVLHAFEKKTPKTSKTDLDLASTRYRQLVSVRKKK